MALTVRRFGLNEQDGQGILFYLRADGQLTQWGLCNAITRYSQDVKSYDYASELEAVGGRVIDLSPSAWREIAEAKSQGGEPVMA